MRSDPYTLGGYREAPPPAELRDLAEAVWTYTRRACGSPPAGAGHRVLPHLDPSISVWTVRDEAGWVLDTSVRFIGPTHTIRIFHPEPGLHVAAVRIKVEWIRPLLGLDAREWTDVVAPLPPGDRIVRLLAGTAGPDHGFGDLSHLCRVLADLSRSATSERRARLAHAGLEHLRSRARATLGLERVAAALGVSLRHLAQASPSELWAERRTQVARSRN